MEKPDKLLELLLDVLRAIDFDRRYYGFYDRIRDRTAGPVLSKTEMEKILSTTARPFRYNSKERFFSTEQRLGQCTLTLKVAIQYGQVELILDLQTPRGVTGDPLPALANSVGEMRAPDFSPDPPFPRLPFSNAEEYREIIQFGVELLSEIADALVKSGVCGSEK